MHVVDAFVAKFGCIDVLVNNAGTAINRPFAEKSAEEVQRSSAREFRRHILDEPGGRQTYARRRVRQDRERRGGPTISDGRVSGLSA
jgi:NAD(P)-dependent dehydrogenase (short-subunit alcohol dehydrogenase family)